MSHLLTHNEPCFREERGVKLLFIHQLLSLVTSPPLQAAVWRQRQRPVQRHALQEGCGRLQAQGQRKQVNTQNSLKKIPFLNKLWLIVALELKVFISNNSWSGFLFDMVPNFGNTPLHSAPQRTLSVLCCHILLSVYQGSTLLCTCLFEMPSLCGVSRLRFTVRDFQYNEEEMKADKEEMTRLSTDKKKQFVSLLPLKHKLTKMYYFCSCIS